MGFLRLGTWAWTTHGCPDVPGDPNARRTWWFFDEFWAAVLLETTAMAALPLTRGHRGIFGDLTMFIMESHVPGASLLMVCRDIAREEPASFFRMLGGSCPSDAALVLRHCPRRASVLFPVVWVGMEQYLSLFDQAIKEDKTRVSDGAGRVVLIQDCVETSGAFLLHHLMKRALSRESSETVVFVAFAQPFSHYDRILKKLVSSLYD
ncbi:hypothetical protein Sjap_018200 [Stephania japonica]|uniref:Elongator complex protein 6 n=1 Tax=Stephania japonica TaxID=461633 RepID=A0AAP0NLA8_9MAGN